MGVEKGSHKLVLQGRVVPSGVNVVVVVEVGAAFLNIKEAIDMDVVANMEVVTQGGICYRDILLYFTYSIGIYLQPSHVVVVVHWSPE